MSKHTVSAMPSHRGSGVLIAAMVVLSLLLGACGSGETAGEASPSTTLFGDEIVADPETGASDTEPDTDAGTATTAATQSSDTSQADETSETTEATTSADSDLPDAPDFTLELGEGGEFVLSAEQRPVYLIFWAEW